jgi:hypothetical protein
MVFELKDVLSGGWGGMDSTQGLGNAIEILIDSCNYYGGEEDYEGMFWRTVWPLFRG